MLNLKFKIMKKSVFVLIHIVFWLIIWLVSISLFRLSSFPLQPWNVCLSFTWPVMFLYSIPFYIFFFYAKLILKNIKYLIPLLLLIVPYYFFTLYTHSGFQYKYSNTLLSFSTDLLFGLLGALFQFFTDWFKKNEMKLELERKNNESNLALLRTQINPHFLFNTLNNIDTLIHFNQTKASKSLNMLSDIMRYMLMDAKSDRVELQSEIEHLENYLSLEQLRLKNEKFLNYSISGIASGIRIAPMIMIPFVENAFKHSVDSTIEDGIIIKIAIENDLLNFTCDNHFDKLDTDNDKVHGIGLNTVKKRLDLIYKDKYKLLINSDSFVYKVKLEIKLNEN